MKAITTLFGLLLAFYASCSFAQTGANNYYDYVTDPIFNSRKTMAATSPSSTNRITTLDVMGIGLSLEMYRQSDSWKALQQHLSDSILPNDPSKYESNRTMKGLISDKRAADTLEYGASQFVEHWPIPSVSVWSNSEEEEKPSIVEKGKTTYSFFYDRIDDLRMPAGMHYHRIAGLGSYLRNDPEEILERAFQFFDANPDAPALLILVSDGDQTRALTGDMSREKYWGEGPRKPGAMTESFVVLVLARRDRVDALRPFATAPGQSAKPGFKPSRFLPEPWTTEQIKQFDALPTIAVLHRPERITYRKDKDGKPTFDPKLQQSSMYDQARQAAFKSAFDAALQTIPDHKPARIFYDAGDASNGKNIIPLSLAVHNSLPEFDLFKPDEGYDISARIGNTGAASPFVMWALSAIASHEKQDASIAVDLRQKDEAMITVITSSTDKHSHPAGDPIDFKLAPQNGSLTPPVAPPASGPVPSTAAAKPKPRATALGTKLVNTKQPCPQTGYWVSSVDGERLLLRAGEAMPPAKVYKPQTRLEKLTGKAPEYERVETVWTLMDYADNGGKIIEGNS